MKQKKSIFITDLDNTLFDWVDLWINCFSPMLDKIVEISGISKERLIPEIATVHQKHGTSEYSFLIEELPALTEWLNGRPAIQTFAPAISIYQERRREHLKLFPSVMETLKAIKSRGTLIVGYTESMAFYSNYRVRKLELDGILDFIYCPTDHTIPTNINVADLRKYSAEHYRLEKTRQSFTPAGSKKPDSKVLNKILLDLTSDKSQCAYIGDSLMKDIAMANDCGVTSVWAQYGQAHKRPEYKLLQEVTHWTAAEVKREQEINAREHVVPDHVAKNGMSDVLDFFEFSRYEEGSNRGN